MHAAGKGYNERHILLDGAGLQYKAHAIKQNLSLAGAYPALIVAKGDIAVVREAPSRLMALFVAPVVECAKYLVPNYITRRVHPLIHPVGLDLKLAKTA